MREFMGHLTRTPPPGFRGATIESILRADTELWTRVADKVRSNLRPDKDNDFPVDKALEELYTSASVLFHLLPLPNGGAQGTKRKAETEAAPKATPAPSAPGGKNRPSKRNRQGKTNLPKGLHGYNGWNKQKQRICYNYNMAHGCNNSVSKEGNLEKCSRGMHQCIKCHGKHSLTQCNNN